MDVLHHHLEPVEASRFRHLDFSGETLSQIFKHDAVTSSEKAKHVLDVVLLISRQRLPVLRVLAEVNFVNGPEAGHLILVHLPNVFVDDG